MNTKENMICPACGDPLDKIKSGKITVDACVDGCGGIWFDSGELAKVNEPDEKDGEKLLKIKTNPYYFMNKNKQHICPICHVNMTAYPITTGEDIIIDECPSCGGAWLDGGEFAKFRDGSSELNYGVFNKAEFASMTRENAKPWHVKLLYFLYGEENF